MLISSPPRGPCSCVQSSPVSGCSAAPCRLRWPYDQISGNAPSRPTNGLSAGTPPSGVMRRTLPMCVPRSCALSRCELRSPVVTKRLPSRANTRREPKWWLLLNFGCWRKMTLRSASAPPVEARAGDRGAVRAVLRRAPRRTGRSSSSRRTPGRATTSSSPPWPSACTAGTPAIGSESAPSRVT